MCVVFPLSPLSVLVPSEKEAEIHRRALGRGDAGEKVKGKDVEKSLFELQPKHWGIASWRSSLQMTGIHSIMCVGCTVQIWELAKPMGPAWAVTLADAK